MPLTHIEYGSLASSEVMNDNFEYLDNRITTVADTLTTASSSIYSNIASVNSTLSQADEDLASDISDLESYAQAIRSDFDSQNNAPDYSKGIGITLPYTVVADGYVYGGVDGTDSTQYVQVNGKPVHGHCGYSGGKFVYSGSTFRVSAGDVVTKSRSGGSYYFYPMKGAGVNI